MVALGVLFRKMLLLIVLGVNLKIALRMCAGGAKLGRIRSNNDMSAVAAFPNLDLTLCKDLCHLDVLQQGAVTLLVMLLDLGNQAEFCRKLREALLFGGLGESGVHIGPFVVLAVCCFLKVSGGVTDTCKLLQPQLCVLLLIVCSFEKKRGDLLVAFLFCNRGEVGILIAY